MEEHLNKDRREMQKAVASNMRMMESQERCINELIEEINRLQILRGAATATTSSPVPLPLTSTVTTNRRNGLHGSTPSSQPPCPSSKSWW